MTWPEAIVLLVFSVFVVTVFWFADYARPWTWPSPAEIWRRLTNQCEWCDKKRLPGCKDAWVHHPPGYGQVLGTAVHCKNHLAKKS